MSESDRDDSGRFTDSVTDQTILKIFDRVDEPFLTAAEISAELSLTRQGVSGRLKRMEADGLVDRKEAGASAVGWWATVAPAPSEATEVDIMGTRGELERGETVGQDEMKRRLGIDE